MRRSAEELAQAAAEAEPWLDELDPNHNLDEEPVRAVAICGNADNALQAVHAKTSTPSPYAELVGVIESVPLLLREARRARGLSLRAAAAQIGIAPATVCRIEAGTDCALSNAVAVLRWLDQRQVATAPSLSPDGGDVR